MLSTPPSPSSHLDHSKTIYFSHNPFLSSLASLAITSSGSHAELSRLTPSSFGKPRALSTVAEAPTPEATTPEPPELVGSQSPQSQSRPVPVPVPPRVSSASTKARRPGPGTTSSTSTAASGTNATGATGATGTTGATNGIHGQLQHLLLQQPASRRPITSALPVLPILPVTVSTKRRRGAFTQDFLSKLNTAAYATATTATTAAPHPPVPASSSAPASFRRHLCLAANDSLLDKPTASMDANMADNHTARTPPRDSHEISLSPRDITRDSLVVNMLLSLDQFSFGQSPTDFYSGSNRGPGAATTAATAAGHDDDDDDDDDDYSSRPYTNNTNDSTTRSRGRYDSGRQRHRHRLSYSSDLDVGIFDDFKKRQSTACPPSRGRRSNSGSSSLQTTQFPRLNSMREMSYRNQANTRSPPRSSHARGGMHSNKSSSSLSVDMTYANDSMNQRLVQRAGRSASFDHGPQQLSLASSFGIDFAESFVVVDDDYDDYDAAPTPNVPGGPRREASGLRVGHPPPPPQPVDSRTSERRLSTGRSLKSCSAGKSTKGVVAQSAWAMASDELDCAPAPSVGYGKSKNPESSTNAASQVKERPGFFRRVFGSSKASAPANSNIDLPPTSTPRHPSSPNPTTNVQHQPPATPSRATTVPPSRDTSSSHSYHHPKLQKKSSSFFRRRKKSVADEAPSLPSADQQVPPVPPLRSVANIQQAKHETPAAVAAQNSASPTSSLRQVMNPYLRESATGLGLTGVAVSTPLADITNTPSAKSDTHVEARNEEFKRDFSRDYQPSPNARIRRVKPEADTEQLGSTPPRASKQTQKKLRNSNSFLDLDAGSDNDDAGHGTRKKSSKQSRLTSSSASRVKNDAEDRDATIRGKKNPLLDLVEGSRPSAQPTLGAPVDGGRSTSFASGSTGTGYKTAPSVAPSLLVEDTGDSSPKFLGTLEAIKSCKPLDEPEFIVGEPTEDDRQKAQRIYDGGEEFIQKDKAAAWMGEQGPIRQRTLQAYMELYNFTDQSILTSLRQVCGRLVLRAETQQVDRILVAFSKRWCDCNAQHGFKATDVIHTICYSIMLLNTDLHVADIEQKMTRSQFIKNTMTTITQAVAESAPGAFVRPSILPDKNPMLSADPGRRATENSSRSHRNSFRPSPRSDTNSSDYDGCGPLVTSSFHGSMRSWQEQVEIVLKSIYASIREERLPLFGAENERPINPAPSQGSLSVLGMLKRSPSILSKAPSETQLSSRGRVAENGGRTSASRWTSKSRSRPGLGRTGMSSSRTSFDDGNSMWSPALSSATWSKHSLGRTQRSMSQDSFASSMPRGDYQQSIGFANALSQAIIRDEDANGQEKAPSILSADASSTQFLEDESLELAGPPWIKEGMVMHKHHLDGYGKRAKDRHWTEVFAVVQKGHISMFSFNASKSMRQKSRSRNGGRPMGPVGGGNWQDNAVNLGTFNLRLTLASALPPPGYSRSRPHVWALSLPTGAVHLFQVGTPEIIREFVHTANYWSARLSTHPLVGGISNIEYGWSDAIVNNALVSAINESATCLTSGGRNSQPGSSAAHVRKSSAASGSFRGSSFDHVSGAFTNNSGRGKLPGDRIHIAEWAPPTQSMRPSNATETEQLQVLITYVKSIEEELQSHNQLRSSMLLAFTPRGHNAGKAMANWERKSAYLLREIVKFRTYLDCLQQAEARKREIYAERDLAQKAARGELSDGDMEMTDDEDADETLRP